MKNSFTTIFLVILSVGVFYVYVQPQYTKIQDLIIQKTEYKDALDKAEQVAVKRDELLKEYNAISKENMTRLDRILPLNLNTVKLVADINSVGGRHGITIRNVGVTEPIADNAREVATGATKKPFQSTTIRFLFDADYNKLKDFLRDLEASLQLIDIQSIKISKITDLSGMYSYDVSIQTYWIK